MLVTLLTILVLGLVVWNVKNHLLIRKFNPYLSSLLSVSASSTGDLHKYFSNALNLLSSISKSQCSILFFCEENKGVLKYYHSTIKDSQFNKLLKDIYSSKILDEIIQKKEPRVINNFSAPGSHIRDTGERTGFFNRLLIIPIIENNSVTAILVETGKKEIYTKSDLSSLLLFTETFWKLSLIKRTDEKIAESEKLYRLISENTTDVIWLLDPYNYRYTYVSPSIINFSGYSPEEIYKLPLSEILTQKSYDFITKTIPLRLTKFHSGDLNSLTNVSELEQIHKNGSIIFTEVSTKLLTGDDNKIISILGVSRDISARKRIEEKLLKNERAYRLVFNNVPVSIMYFDHSGKINDMNEEFVNLIGSSRETLQKINLFLLPDKTIVRAVENALQGIQSRFETDYHAITSGRVIPIIANFSPIIDEQNNITGGVGIIDDISERKQMERIFFHDILNTAGNLWNIAQILKNENLESDIKDDLFHKMNEISGTLIKEIKMQRNFISHEPDESKPDIEQLEINELIISTLSLFINPANLQENRLIFNSGCNPLMVETDPVMLSRVFRNMIKNAIEAEVNETKIIITLSQMDEFYRFSVHNESVMTDIVKERIFTKRISTKGSGRGLGTFSMKLITENYLNGSINFVSEEGKGTTFTVELPLVFDRKKNETSIFQQGDFILK